MKKATAGVPVGRRTFMKAAAAAAMTQWPAAACASVAGVAGMPARLGGSKAHDAGWPRWPRWISETDEQSLMSVVRSGVWSRAGTVNAFEKQWAAAMGAKRCLAVVNGTQALITALAQLNIGAGDEVILPPYTSL